HLLALLLSRANSIDRVPHHLESLKRDHDLVVLNKIAGQQQKLCRFHRDLHVMNSDWGIGRATALDSNPARCATSTGCHFRAGNAEMQAPRPCERSQNPAIL